MENPFFEITKRLANIEDILLDLKHSDKGGEDRFMTIREVSEYLHLSVASVYGLTSRREIPHQKRGKRLYFLKSEIDEWLKSGRQATIDELKESL